MHQILTCTEERRPLKLINLFCRLIHSFFFFFLPFQNKVADPLFVFLEAVEKSHVAAATCFGHHFPSSTSALPEDFGPQVTLLTPLQAPQQSKPCFSGFFLTSFPSDDSSQNLKNGSIR